MARVVIAASPIEGHTAPMLSVARGLSERGHDVTFLGATRFRERIEQAGAQFATLPQSGPGVGDPGSTTGKRRAPRGMARINAALSELFVDPMVAQAEALRESIDRTAADVVLVEPMFLGALPLLLGHRRRPPIVVCGIVALQITSRDTAPPGTGLAPSSSPLGHIRNVALNRLMNGMLLAPSQRRANALLAAAGCPRSPTFVVEWVRLADLLLQCTGPSFEYPRRDLPGIVTFVGPLMPPAPAFTPPSWWADLDGGKPIVHVTQGTVDNRDLGRLVAPALAALANDDALVVVTTGGPPASAIPGPLPANARITSFLPYDQLLPKVDVMVTNGGYGGVQHALAAGVPLVVAGVTEDKLEVAARVAWSGAGINLRRGRPAAAAIRAAVQEVRRDPRYRQRAQALRSEFEQLHALDSITVANDSG